MISCKQMQSWRHSHKTTSLPAWEKTDSSSSRHLLSHNTTEQLTRPHRCSHSLEINPHDHVETVWDCASLLSLFFTTLLVMNELCCHIMLEFSTANTWVQKWVMITHTFIKHPSVPTSTHTQMHKNAAGQDNKAGGLEFPMYALTALHFSAFPVRTAIGRQEWGPMSCLTADYLYSLT